jgi:hypothetical protein
MSTIIGKIASLEGTFYIKGLDGSLREVSVGDEILEGESIVGDKNSNTPLQTLTVDMSDGHDMIILGHDKQLFDTSLLSKEFTTDETVTQNDTIQNIIEENGDAETAAGENIEDLETAAGEGQAESTEGGEGRFADANNGIVDINADLRDRAFVNETPEPNPEIIIEDVPTTITVLEEKIR